jgi:FkbM family methyltransferase
VPSPLLNERAVNGDRLSLGLEREGRRLPGGIPNNRGAESQMAYMRQWSEAHNTMPAFKYTASGSPVAIRLACSAISKLGGRGLGWVARCLSPFFPGRQVCIRFVDGSILRFPACDPYWNGALYRFDFDYEPEIRNLLLRLKEKPYWFIDCGANIGYWAVLASSPLLGCKPTIAIEPGEIFDFLQRNREANAGRFDLYDKAVFDSDGKKLAFSKFGNHASDHITHAHYPTRDVVSITLDTLASQRNIDPRESVVIKLDIEGAEIPALEGCRELLKRDTLIVYEDHAQDREHNITRFIMRVLDLPVFALAPDGTGLPVTELNVLDQIKSDPDIGYNFLTCPRQSSFYKWLTDIRG